MEKKNLMGHINENSPWQELTDGGFVLGAGNSAWFNTGDWRVRTPIWSPDKCKQCLLCYPVCPDSSIPVQGGKRQDFDFMHCKGCAICARVCPFGAIAVANVGEEGTVEAENAVNAKHEGTVEAENAVNAVNAKHAEMVEGANTKHEVTSVRDIGAPKTASSDAAFASNAEREGEAK